jgi:hypothetical protein
MCHVSHQSLILFSFTTRSTTEHTQTASRASPCIPYVQSSNFPSQLLLPETIHPTFPASQLTPYMSLTSLPPSPSPSFTLFSLPPARSHLLRAGTTWCQPLGILPSRSGTSEKDACCSLCRYANNTLTYLSQRHHILCPYYEYFLCPYYEYFLCPYY